MIARWTPQLHEKSRERKSTANAGEKRRFEELGENAGGNGMPQADWQGDVQGRHKGGDGRG